MFPVVLFLGLGWTMGGDPLALSPSWTCLDLLTGCGCGSETAPWPGGSKGLWKRYIHIKEAYSCAHSDAFVHNSENY